MIRHPLAVALLAAGVVTAHAAPNTSGFKLESPDIKPASMIDKKFEFNGFGCGGENKSPALKWSNPPKGVKSYAVTAYDPDAPTGSGWWHWSVVNIPADTKELKADAGNASNANLPAGAKQVRIDYGVAAWGGVCPPEGDKAHRYVFTVYALKTDKLDLPPDATAALAGFMINANAIDKASFVAKYARPKDLKAEKAEKAAKKAAKAKKS